MREPHNNNNNNNNNKQQQATTTNNSTDNTSIPGVYNVAVIITSLPLVPKGVISFERDAESSLFGDHTGRQV